MNAILVWEIHDQQHHHPVSAQSQILIGRSDDCDVVLPFKTVSRQHAILSVRDNTVFLTNLSRVNTIRLREERHLKHKDMIPLRPGERFRVGPVEMRLARELDAEGATIKIRCTGCRRVAEYDPKGFCSWCGTALAAGQTVIE